MDDLRKREDKLGNRQTHTELRKQVHHGVENDEGYFWSWLTPERDHLARKARQRVSRNLRF